VATQLSETASIPKCLPMDGRAILTEDPMNGVRKEASVATSSTAALTPPSLLLGSMRGIIAIAAGGRLFSDWDPVLSRQSLSAV
jgi:hypothetical protein